MGSPSHDDYHQHILSRIEAGAPITQRSLAKELGIALGLTNLLIHRVIKKGWVKAVNVRRNRIHYLITPEGIAEKARVTRAYFDNTMRLYTETRDQIRQNLDRLSYTWPADHLPAGQKRIVFYGCGEVAEIAFICLDGTDLRLVGVVDDKRQKPFFGIPVHPPIALSGDHLNGYEFGRLVVTSFRRADDIRARLETSGYPLERVFWLE